MDKKEFDLKILNLLDEDPTNLEELDSKEIILDSLSSLEIIAFFDEELNLSISYEDIEKIKLFSDLRTIASSRLSNS